MGLRANRHRNPLVAETVAYLRHLGADGIDVAKRQNGFKIVCRVDGRPIALALPRVERCVEVQTNMARQQVRRRFRAAGVEVRA